MKRIILLSVLLAVLAVCIPLLFVSRGDEAPGPSPAGETEAVASPSPSAAVEDTVSYSDTRVADSETLFTALIGGELVSVNMADYLPGTLAGEMPASFEDEALKAQAVAARTYILYRMSHATQNHPDAAVCDDSTCCKAYLTEEALRERWGDSYGAYLEKITAAVTATDGEYLSYEGEAILAVFHSSSAGMTEDCGNVWGDVPYLLSVTSPETAGDVPNFITTVEVSAEDFRQTVTEAYPEAVFGDDPALWVGELALDASGRVSSVVIGGVSAAGTKLRTLFSLRSTAFTLEYAEGRFLFTVTGYGHGVGMSQYGANVMAQNGSGYAEILTHYYPGTALSG